MHKNYKIASSPSLKLACSNATATSIKQIQNPQVKALMNERNKLKISISKQKRKNQQIIKQTKELNKGYNFVAKTNLPKNTINMNNKYKILQNKYARWAYDLLQRLYISTKLYYFQPQLQFGRIRSKVDIKLRSALCFIKNNPIKAYLSSQIQSYFQKNKRFLFLILNIRIIHKKNLSKTIEIILILYFCYLISFNSLINLFGFNSYLKIFLLHINKIISDQNLNFIQNLYIFFAQIFNRFIYYIIPQYNMNLIDVQKQVQSILKQGFLDKQSRFLKTWRSRWFVLTPQALMTFKQRKVYNSPTQVIPLKTITSIKSADEETSKQFSFRLDTDQQSFFVVASSNSQKQQWIGQIGKAMVKLNTKMDE